MDMQNINLNHPINGDNKDWTASDWINAKYVPDATTAFCYVFERPANPKSSLTQRIEFAEAFYQKYHGKTMYEGVKEFFNFDGHTFPHYEQKNYDRKYGKDPSTIASSGCAPSSLAIILAGLLDDPTITPVRVVEDLERYYTNYTSYYVPGEGTIVRNMLYNDFLGKYYGVQATYIGNPNDITPAIETVASGKCAIGSVKDHIIAIIPPPENYQDQGYKFFIIDSGRDLTGPYRSAQEVLAKPKSYGKFNIGYIIEKIQ